MVLKNIGYSSNLSHGLQMNQDDRVGSPSPLLDRVFRAYYSADSGTEVDRALDNLNKSGKQFMGSSRRDSLPMMGGPRQYSEFGM